jgi:nickel/cobalt transporter (NicO) family protein
MRRILVLLAALLGPAAAAPATASAHPLGNFTINRYSLIVPEQGQIRITFVVDMAEIPTFQALGAANGSTAAAAAFARRETPLWAGRLDLRVNGKRLRLSVDPDGVRASLRAGQAGLDILRVEVHLVARVRGRGPYAVSYHDRSFGSHLGWKEIVVHPGTGVVITRSSAATRDVSDMLRHYPSGLLQTPLDVSSATIGYRAGAGRSVSVAPELPAGGADVGRTESRFTSLIGHRELTPGFVAVALLLAMFWGALHALSPGHGKSIVAAYLVGSRGTPRHAVLLGLTVTATHTSGVFALGLITLFLSSTVAPEAIYPWLALASGVLVLVMGAGILSRRLGRAQRPHSHHHDHGEGHRHDHTHVPPGGDGSAVTLRSLLALGVSGGLLPCPSALVVMLGAVALHRTAFGLALVVAFSLGLALTLTAVGLLVLSARRLLGRLPARAGRLAELIPILSAAVITLLGAALTARALDAFPAGSAFAAGHRGALLVATMAIAALAGAVHARRRRRPQVGAIAVVVRNGSGRR